MQDIAVILYGVLDKNERPVVRRHLWSFQSLGRIYIHAVDDIRAALLDHLNEPNPTPDFRSVTGFAFELCDTA